MYGLASVSRQYTLVHQHNIQHGIGNRGGGCLTALVLKWPQSLPIMTNIREERLSCFKKFTGEVCKKKYTVVLEG